MGRFISPNDLKPFATIDSDKADALIDDAEAMAMLLAPCLEDDDDLSDAQKDAVKAVLRGAILRKNDAGSGASTQLAAGPFSQTITPTTHRSIFWPTEISQLQSICSNGDGAFTVDTAPGMGAHHLPWCSLMLGAKYCSCGTDIAGRPIYELD